MNGLILVEGNKSTFKSSITNYLKKTFDCEVEKGIPKGNDSLLGAYKYVEDAQVFLYSFWREKLLKAQSKLIVLDRTYITPIVYHGVFSDSSRQFVYVSDEQRIIIENEIKKIPYALIYLHDTADNLWNRYTMRGTHEIEITDFIRNKDELVMLNQKYEVFFRKTTCLDYLDIDCQNSYSQIISSIESYIVTRIK